MTFPWLRSVLVAGCVILAAGCATSRNSAEADPLADPTGGAESSAPDSDVVEMLPVSPDGQVGARSNDPWIAGDAGADPEPDPGPRYSEGEPPSVPGGTVNHVVQPGDTLWEIARRHTSKVAWIKEANGLQTDLIQVGQVLRVPTSNP